MNFRDRRYGRSPFQASHPKNLIRASIYDIRSGPMKFPTRMYHISNFETASCTNWSKRWTYRVFIMNTRPDWILRGMSPPREREVSGPPKALRGLSHVRSLSHLCGVCGYLSPNVDRLFRQSTFD